MAVIYKTTPSKLSNTLTFEKYNTDGRPSWRRHFDGRTNNLISFRANDSLVEIVASEVALPNDRNKRYVEKQVFLDLNRKQALQLRDYLNATYPEEV